MENTTGAQRPWDWTPPKSMNRIMKTILHLPLLHRMMSGMILVIKFTGRKTGNHYETPVGYHQHGDTILMLTKRFRKWWHNFEDEAPVTLRLKGQDVQAHAEALTDPDTIVPILTEMIAEVPREAEIYGVKLINGKPDPDSVREVAPKVVVIRATLQR